MMTGIETAAPPFRRLTRIAMIAAGAAALASCAYVNAVPVRPGSPVQGIRIYDVKPLLVVTETAATVELVPNYNRAYALQFGSFLSKHTFSAKFSGGMMTEINSTQDSTDIAKALIDLAQKAAGFSLKGAENTNQSKLQVYSIDFDNDGNLIGLTPLLRGAELITTARRSVLGGGNVNGPTPNPGVLAPIR